MPADAVGDRVPGLRVWDTEAVRAPEAEEVADKLEVRLQLVEMLEDGLPLVVGERVAPLDPEGDPVDVAVGLKVWLWV